ncbi:MAG: PLP-dependent transferase [Akkermansia sp.]|nr:PLP-dependent transferase [Akkermansia sp.]
MRNTTSTRRARECGPCDRFAGGSHPDHELYTRYFPNGAGSVFTFEIKGTSKDAGLFCENLELFSLLANVADAKSLVIHPAGTTHSQLNELELANAGIKPNTIRLSIGIEHIDDLLEDLDRAFTIVK